MINPAIYTVLACVFAQGMFAQGTAPLKPASINVQAAILSTKEGQKATQDLQAKFMPRRQALEKKQADLAALQSRMRSGSSTMAPQAKEQLIADIDARTKEGNR